MKKFRFFVGVIVFVVTVVSSLVVLKPDPTPHFLTAKAFVPANKNGQNLQNDWNIQKIRGEDKEIELQEFQKMAFEETYLYADAGINPGYTIPQLNYLGRNPERKIFHASIYADKILPQRSVLYFSRWSTFFFDPETGKTEVRSELGLESLGLALIVLGLILALTAAFTFPRAWDDLSWLPFLANGLANGAIFYFWQTGKQGFATEGFIWTSVVGIMAVWLTYFEWKELLDDVYSSRSDFALSVFFAGVGVFLETSGVLFLFGTENSLLDYLWLAILCLVPNLILNIYGWKRMGHRIR